MGYCPGCGYEYEDGIVACPTCGEELLDEPPETGAAYREMIEVARLADPREAELLAGELEAAGIPVRLADEHGAELFAGAGAVEVRVLVPEEWAEEARELIRSLEDEEHRP